MKTIKHGLYCVFIQGVIQLFVVVYDADSISGNDLIDRFVIDFSVTSSSSLSTISTFTGTYGSIMTVSKTLTCSANYYGSLCSTFCVAQNSDALGHYTCNPNDGSFVCNNGYSGSDCKTREFYPWCYPRTLSIYPLYP